MNCPKCGKENPEGANFCIYCQTQLNADFKQNEELEKELEESKKEAKKALLDKTTAETETDRARRDLQRTVRERNDERRKNRTNLMIVGGVLAALIILMGAIYFSHRQRAAEVTALETTVASVEVMADLPGNYAMRCFDGETQVGASQTAVVRSAGTDEYDITVITEYGPEHHAFHADAAGNLTSATLGQGSVTFKSSVNKTTITFNNGTQRWELTR